MRYFSSNLLNRLEKVSVLDTDSPKERRRKVTLVVITILCCTASIIWGTTYYVILGPTLTMFLTYAFTIVVGTAILIYFITKRFALLLYIFFFMILWNPIAMQWSLGGFATSGGVMIWSILAPFCSLMFQDIRKATFWFLAYLALIFVSLYLDAYSSQWAVPLSHRNSMLFFGMNTIGPSMTIFFTMMYFVNAFQKEHTRAEKLVHDLGNTNNKLESTLKELKESQAELVQSEKMASLGHLVAGISHELNSPVGAINSMHNTLIRAIDKLKNALSQAFPREYEGNRTIQSSFKVMADANRVITTGTERVTRIVRSLRSFARLDEAEFQVADLHEGVESTLTLLHSQMEDKIAVKKDFGDIKAIFCSPSQLNQVFMHLLRNAIQSIEGKGEIKIKTFEDDNEVYVQIRDTGKGIPPEQLEHIFDIGFSAEGSRVEMEFGLSTDYNIIQEHQGEIKVESEVGKGTEVTIRLPITKSDVG